MCYGGHSHDAVRALVQGLGHTNAQNGTFSGAYKQCWLNVLSGETRYSYG